MPTQGDKESALYAHAMLETRDNSEEEVRRCRRRQMRAKNRLLFGPAVNVAMTGVSVLASEYDELREGALKRQSAFCAACGRCTRLGLTPP